jgi:hypothetical protein
MLRLRSWFRAQINALINPRSPNQSSCRPNQTSRRPKQDIWTYLEKRGRSASEIAELKKLAARREAEELARASRS